MGESEDGHHQSFRRKIQYFFFSYGSTDHLGYTLISPLLETKCENLRMEEDEPLGKFTAKLNTISSEAAVIGDKYS